jgi:2-succinyl-5-enolpyruvyl-6-hydroxy-3-cyclohexene-1-carboxylate synthase
MYSDLKNVQIIVALLKEYDINHIVISAGTRHTPLVYSVEHDDFFNCYSIVDERSASFFAIGLIQQLKKPVAICCTSGTASCNYVSAAHEAFYQQLPLLIITADRNPYYLFQQEEQMVPQLNLYKDVCKKVVTLPIVRDEKDFWYCSRVVNEALLELEHREKGPVHINFPVENDYPIHQGIVKFQTEKLPDVKKINRLSLEDDNSFWKNKVEELKKAQKILIIYGQNSIIDDMQKSNIESFCKKYNSVLVIDHLSNLHCRFGLKVFTVCKLLNDESFQQLTPDIVITMHGSSVYDFKSRMVNGGKQFKHWHVSQEGIVSDPFAHITDIIECSPKTFFSKFNELNSDTIENSYFSQWNSELNKISNMGGTENCEIEYSSVYVVQKFITSMPKNSIFHIANSNSVRIAQFFPLDESIEVYCNRGANGIDGSMSSFIGQSNVSGKLSFLLIGDLSFFYDMNALWNKYVGNNVRILVCNNEGGGIFHAYPNTKNVPTLDRHIAAKHTTSVKEWVESRGFLYLSSKNKVEFNEAVHILMTNRSDVPIILEAFTDKDIDVAEMGAIVNNFKTGTSKLKSKVASFIPESMKSTIKKVIK